MDWLRWLFDADSFVTRDRCGDWGTITPAVYRAASWVIALSYFFIAASLALVVRKNYSMFLRFWIGWGFVTFVFWCGMTHVMDAAAFVWAPYRLFTLVLLVTAMVSAATAACMPAAINRMALYRSPEEYETKNAELREKQAKLEFLMAEKIAFNKQLVAEKAELMRLVEEAHHKEFNDARYRKMMSKLHGLQAMRSEA